MIRIVLDAGHGGKDPGAVANGLKEKDLTLAIVKHIGRMLGEYEGVEVHYTRIDDRFLELEERAEIANKLNADFFCSVHINSGGGTGFESYIYNRTTNAKTIAFQNVIHAEIMKAIGNVKDRGKKRANYAVLREIKMPAILTENLFIDNASDASKLKSQEFLLKIAYGHVQGFEKAFRLKKKAKLQPKENAAEKKLYRVQVGAFSDRTNAERLTKELKEKGYPAIIKED
jgi:N-acetylmuramoyl-L-alanine amidase